MTSVRPLQLAMVQIDRRWAILVNGRQVGRFDRRTDAARCVHDIAGQTRCDGHPVEVLMQEPFGELRSVGPGFSRPL